MSKPEKPAAAEAPNKSKKMLIIALAAAIGILAGGAAAFMLLKPAHAPDKEAAAEESHPEVPPKFVELGTFTANLMHEEGDRYLQVAITLKLTKPELEEKIKASSPEIMHRVNMLLQSKTPSELAPMEGKEKLAGDIKAQVEYVIGIRKTLPLANAAPAVAQSSVPAADEKAPPHGNTEQPAQGQAEHAAAEHAAPAEKVVADGGKMAKSGIAEVLFTSFIIQ